MSGRMRTRPCCLWRLRLRPARSEWRHWGDGLSSMRIAAALLTIVCVAACSAAPTQSASEQAFMDQDSWRQQQAVLDAQAILEGMAQARLRAEQQARTAR
jgi:hypothetical protein